MFIDLIRAKLVYIKVYPMLTKTWSYLILYEKYYHIVIQTQFRTGKQPLLNYKRATFHISHIKQIYYKFPMTKSMRIHPEFKLTLLLTETLFFRKKKKIEATVAKTICFISDIFRYFWRNFHLHLCTINVSSDKT